jgi:cation diffusion facilitator CzcD-associated flavoprotein CzcO
MDPSVFGVQPGQHIPGSVVHDYQEEYARHFVIYDKIRFRTRVLSAEHQDQGGWVLRLRVGNDGEASQAEIFARRLIVATGLTSEPFLPQIEGQETFGGLVFHAKDFSKYADTVNPERTKSVTILGGTKFAWDAAYAYASKGVPVDWVIRGEISHLVSCSGYQSTYTYNR